MTPASLPTIWRRYEPGDDADLRIAHRRQCEAFGIDFPFPDFHDPRYLLVEVAVRGGRAVGAVVAHATVEMMFVGGDQAMVRAAIVNRVYFEERLRRAGADEAHAFVPVASLPRMERLLRRLGFRRSNDQYVSFYREF